MGLLNRPSILKENTYSTKKMCYVVKVVASSEDEVLLFLQDPVILRGVTLDICCCFTPFEILFFAYTRTIKDDE